MAIDRMVTGRQGRTVIDPQDRMATGRMGIDRLGRMVIGPMATGLQDRMGIGLMEIDPMVIGRLGLRVLRVLVRRGPDPMVVGFVKGKGQVRGVPIGAKRTAQSPVVVGFVPRFLLWEAAVVGLASPKRAAKMLRKCPISMAAAKNWKRGAKIDATTPEVLIKKNRWRQNRLQRLLRNPKNPRLFRCLLR